MRVLGILILLAFLMLGIGSNITAMIDAPSIIIIAGFTLGGLLLAGVGIGNMIRCVFAADASASDLSAAARAWAQARAYIVAGGIVGTLIGAIIMVKNLDDVAALGPGIAICLLTALYAAVLGFGIFLPLQRRLEDRVQEQGA